MRHEDSVFSFARVHTVTEIVEWSKEECLSLTVVIESSYCSGAFGVVLSCVNSEGSGQPVRENRFHSNASSHRISWHSRGVRCVPQDIASGSALNKQKQF